MPLTSTISEDGKVAIPEAIREGFHLLPGQTLFWSVGDDGGCFVIFDKTEWMKDLRKGEVEKIKNHPFFGCEQDAATTVEEEMGILRGGRYDAL